MWERVLLLPERSRMIKVLIPVTLFFIVLLSYGQTTSMFYWIDDWGLLFHLIHPDIFPGNLGDPAYRYLDAPFKFLFPMFGLNAKAYFVTAFIQYYLLTLLVCFFIRSLTNNIGLGLSTAMLFGSGYIGSYAIYRISNSFQLVEATFFMIFTIWNLFLYFEKKTVRYYLFSLMSFVVTLEFFFLRSPGLLPIIFTTSIFFGNFNFNRKSVTTFIRLHIPYVLIYFFYFGLDSRVRPGGSSSSRDALDNLSKLIFEEKHFELLNNLFISITNVLIPQVLTQSMSLFINKKIPLTETIPELMILIPIIAVTLTLIIYFLRLRKNLLPTVLCLGALGMMTLFIFWSSLIRNDVWNPTKIELFTISVGLSFIVLLFWSYFAFRNKAPLTKFLPFGIMWIFAIVLGYYVYSPVTSLDSMSRYVIPGFVGTAIIYASIFHFLSKTMFPNWKNDMPAYLLTLFLAIYLIFHVRTDQTELVSYVSNPSKIQFTALQEEFGSKKPSQDAIFYFETIDDGVLRGNLLGGMPHIAVAIAAGFNDGAQIADSYEHLIFLLSSKKVDFGNVHTFFANKNTLNSTSNDFRNLLSKGSLPKVLTKWTSNTPIVNMETQTWFSNNQDQTIGVNPEIEMNVNHPSLIPVELKLQMSAKVADFESIDFPYFDYSSQFSGRNDFSSLENVNLANGSQQFEELFEALVLENQKNEVRNNSQVTASSAGRSTEAVNTLDGRLDSNWSANAANWNGGDLPQEIILDLGYPRSIDTFSWIIHYKMATPTKYTISYSNDNSSWVELRKIEGNNLLTEKTTISINFPITSARYFKMSIFDTFGGRGYPPALKEVWVSKGGVNFDFDKLNQMISCPFCYIEDLEKAQRVINLLEGNTIASIYWTTDRSEDYNKEYSEQFTLNLDGNTHTYKIILPPQGTLFKKVKIGNFILPVKLKIVSSEIRSLSLNELEQRNLVKQFSKD